MSQALITIGEANSQIDKKNGPEIFTVKATINLLRTENILYKSCPSENCKKKVIILIIKVIKRYFISTYNKTPSIKRLYFAGDRSSKWHVQVRKM